MSSNREKNSFLVKKEKFRRKCQCKNSSYAKQNTRSSKTGKINRFLFLSTQLRKERVLNNNYSLPLSFVFFSFILEVMQRRKTYILNLCICMYTYIHTHTSNELISLSVVHQDLLFLSLFPLRSIINDHPFDGRLSKEIKGKRMKDRGGE